MYSRSIFAGAVVSALLIPSCVSAAEITVRPPTNPGCPDGCIVGWLCGVS
jgi:hypothetical protein